MFPYNKKSPGPGSGSVDSWLCHSAFSSYYSLGDILNLSASNVPTCKMERIGQKLKIDGCQVCFVWLTK